ncbi:AMP-binding protein [Nocardioides panzhihuensis]|uniref:O-succinylbenzoic acid--CoA ligase n=1 Tax=Nocardioides panzhihuensis TaxID=860243 RepID=A0A7Z0DSQ2_9ACTN|nr:AMP-binding protein [Nocardioides panzhihuensis]NYI80679.1 O-succinylbenzoic acid--CoA ligase [Nocardioides panzhihuensis]
MNDAAGRAEKAVAAMAEWLAGGGPEHWVVETSGSTGRPKRVMLSRAAVKASAAASARRVGASGQWLLTLPDSYVAGANVIARSLLAGHEPVIAAAHGSFADAAAAMAAGPGFVSLVPTQLHRILESGGDDLAALAGFHTLLLGGGPIDPSLRARAEETGVDVVATYGSAETCGGCVYDAMPLDGVGIAIGTDGRVRISGPTLFDGYQDDPEQTTNALVDGWFLTSDAGTLDEDGRLRILGRVDDMVITGGVKVPAALVARRLREHPAVTAAEALGTPDDEWGQRLVAFVVGDIDATSARDWVAAEHPRSWAPREIVTLDEIPLLDNGKPDRQALLALAATNQGAR